MIGEDKAFTLGMFLLYLSDPVGKREKVGEVEILERRRGGGES